MHQNLLPFGRSHGRTDGRTVRILYTMKPHLYGLFTYIRTHIMEPIVIIKWLTYPQIQLFGQLTWERRCPDKRGSTVYISTSFKRWYNNNIAKCCAKVLLLFKRDGIFLQNPEIITENYIFYHLRFMWTQCWHIIILCICIIK